MLEEINSAGDKEITGDAKRIYSFGGLKVTMDRAIGTAADDEKAGDIERIYDGSFVMNLRQAEDFYSYGVITWVTGKNAGMQMEVKKYYANGKTELFLPMPYGILPGDTFNIAAGCDGNATTCRSRFNNLVNFRGEPYIIGNSYAASYPVSSSDNIVAEGEDVRVGAYKWGD